MYYCHLKDAFFPYPAHTPESVDFGHDGSITPWWWIRPLGQGNVNWEFILCELAAFYEGYMCLEHDPADDVMRGTRSGIEYVHRVADECGIEIEI